MEQHRSRREDCAVRDQPRLCCGVWEHLVECEPHTTWPWTLASLMLQKKQAEADWRQTRDGTEPVSWNRFRALTSRAAAAETTAVEAQQKPQPQAHSRCESQKHRIRMCLILMVRKDVTEFLDSQNVSESDRFIIILITSSSPCQGIHSFCLV